MDVFFNTNYSRPQIGLLTPGFSWPKRSHIQNKQAKPKLSIGPTPGADIKVSI